MTLGTALTALTLCLLGRSASGLRHWQGERLGSLKTRQGDAFFELGATHDATSAAEACSRRDALGRAAGMAAAVVASTTESARVASAATILSDDEFRLKFPFAVAADVLSFLKQEVEQGDADAVLTAMERFGRVYPMFSIGASKGEILDAAVAHKTACLEVGSFLGYSAVRIARLVVPAGGILVCVEGNPEWADVARQVVALAGFTAPQVTFVVDRADNAISSGAVQRALKQARGRDGKATAPAFDFVFLDHSKESYVFDLQRLEQRSLVATGTTVVADNVVYPGAPGYLEWVESGGAGGYATVLKPVPYESVGWETNWQKKDDAMSVSQRV